MALVHHRLLSMAQLYLTLGFISGRPTESHLSSTSVPVTHPAHYFPPAQIRAFSVSGTFYQLTSFCRAITVGVGFLSAAQYSQLL